MTNNKPRAVLSTFEMTVEVAGINIKPGSFATSGSGTIAWTNPVLPADATVVGTKLTGNVQAGGDGITSIAVNGVNISPFTVGEPTPFSIDLGTNLVTSVSASLKKSILTNHSVDYKDIVYTITYQLVAWEVSFINWDGSLINYQVIQPGDDAVAPTAYRRGYVHTGWDKDYTNVSQDLIVTATYREAEVYQVTFLDYNGELISVLDAYEQDRADEPSIPYNNRYGYDFVGWNADLSCIVGDMEVMAIYEKRKPAVSTYTMKPVRYENQSSGWDYHSRTEGAIGGILGGTNYFENIAEYAFDDNRATRTSTRTEYGKAKYIRYYWEPFTIDFDRYILKDIRVCNYSDVSQDASTGFGGLVVTLVGNSRELGNHWLWHSCPWRLYKHSISYDEFLALGSGVEYQAYNVTAVGATTLQATRVHLYELFVELEYIDKEYNIVLDKDEAHVVVGDAFTVNAELYPLDSVITWSVLNRVENCEIVSTSTNGRSCTVKCNQKGEAVLVATSDTGLEASVEVFITDETVSFNEIKVGNNQIRNIMINNKPVKQMYLNEKPLLIYHIPYEGFRYNRLQKRNEIQLFTQLRSENLCKGWLARNANYVGTGLANGGHEAGAIKGPPGSGVNVDVGDVTNTSMVTQDAVPVIPGEKIIISHPTTEYSFGMCGYHADETFAYTYFGEDVGWHNYDYQDDIDIEDPHIETTIPDDVHYIRWCQHFGTAQRMDMEKFVFVRRYTYLDLDLVAYPNNATERGTITYTSSDTNVFVIENGNRLRAVGPGTAQLYVRCGSLRDTVDITIKDNSAMFKEYI